MLWSCGLYVLGRNLLNESHLNGRRAILIFQSRVCLTYSLHFSKLFFSVVQALTDYTALLKPSFIKADVIMLSHSCVHRGKPAGAGLLATAPEF